MIPVASNLDSHNYNIYENQESTSPKLNYPSQKWKKLSYDDTKNQKYKLRLPTEATPFTTSDANIFVLPKVRSKTFYSPVDEQGPSKPTRDEVSFDDNLYEQLKNMPSVYDQYREMNPTAPIGKSNSKIFPSQTSAYN